MLFAFGLGRAESIRTIKSGRSFCIQKSTFDGWAFDYYDYGGLCMGLEELLLAEDDTTAIDGRKLLAMGCMRRRWGCYCCFQMRYH